MPCFNFNRNEAIQILLYAKNILNTYFYFTVTVKITRYCSSVIMNKVETVFLLTAIHICCEQSLFAIIHKSFSIQ